MKQCQQLAEQLLPKSLNNCHDLFYQVSCSGDLDATHLASGIHAGSFVHRVAPNIKDGLSGADDTTHQRTEADSFSNKNKFGYATVSLIFSR